MKYLKRFEGVDDIGKFGINFRGCDIYYDV